MPIGEKTKELWENPTYRKHMRDVHIGKNAGNNHYLYGKNMSGEKNPSWVGDRVGYQGLHCWIIREYGKATRCENLDCKYPRKNRARQWLLKPARFEWANISKEYKRDRNDFIQLCGSCHRKWDLNIININH